MIDTPRIKELEGDAKRPAMVLECPRCGHTEYQPLIASFWRRLAA
jgi:hypothetical protein